MTGIGDPPDTGGKQEDGKQGTQRQKFEYTIKDEAPYRVYFELRSGQQGVRINKFSLGSKLRGVQTYKNHIIDMKQIGRNKIMVVFNSYAKANSIVEHINNENGMYVAYIPKHVVCISGVITGIPCDITTDEIFADLQCEVPIVEVYRLNRYVNGIKEPSNRVSVTFRASRLPEKVRLFCCLSRIQPFVQKVVFCKKCLRYNHKSENCKSFRRCQTCGDRHDDENYENCQQRIKCLHCKKTHATGSVDCPERLRQEQIKSIMAKKNYTYVEAREMVSFTSNNIFEPLNSLQEMPSLAETLAESSNFETQWQQTNNPRTPIKPAVKLYAEKKKQQNKRKRSAPMESSTEATSNAENGPEPTAGPSSTANGIQQNRNQQVNGVALQNPHKVLELEKWKSMMHESNKKIESSVTNKYQNKAMSFYSELISDEEFGEEMKEKLKQAVQKHFQLNQTII